MNSFSPGLMALSLTFTAGAAAGLAFPVGAGYYASGALALVLPGLTAMARYVSREDGRTLLPLLPLCFLAGFLSGFCSGLPSLYGGWALNGDFGGGFGGDFGGGLGEGFGGDFGEGFGGAGGALGWAGGLRSSLERAAAGVSALIDGIPFQKARTAGLLRALLIGDRSGLSAVDKAVFSCSGASHLLALSGLHLGIIYMISSLIFRPVGNSPLGKAVRAILTSVLIVVYTLATGASPSTVRAMLFILGRELLPLTGRKPSSWNILCAALLIQTGADPSVLRSLGFQLSYLAIVGIFLLYPLLDRMYPRDGGSFDPVRKLWQSLSLSISCQTTTAPLVWLRFHTFPHFFLLTNLFAIPLTTVIMGLSILTVSLFALLSPSAAPSVPSTILSAATDLLIRLTESAVSLLFRTLEIISSMGP